MAKTIDTLVSDVYALFTNGVEPSEEALDEFANSMKEMMRRRLTEYGQPRQPTLRMSNLGKPPRQLWYDLKGKHVKEELPPDTLFKFMFGDILEETFLFLAKQAGHEVKQEQLEVRLNGVVGHIDAVIDGHLVDVKSTSKYAFTKFENATLAQDDPFGYMAQLSGYAEAEPLKQEIKGAGFLAIAKELGKITYMPVDLKELEMQHPSALIDRNVAMLEKPLPPPRCYDDEPMGKSGNMKLGVGCSYCPHKEHCWKDANGGQGLRKFIYSTGPVWLTQVNKEPNVFETK